jgi:putative ABC transport system permease protein
MRDALLQDIRYAFRHLRRSPGFAAAAVLTLALGIGANTAMFTVLNALVLQKLPIKDPDGLISMTSRNEVGRERYIPYTAAALLSKDGPFQDVCGYNGGGVLAAEAGGTQTQILVAFISGQCFSAFGVVPILGRPLTDDDAPILTAGNRVTVISHRFWTRVYGADPSVIGRTIRAEGVEVTVVGVAPPKFGGLHIDSGIDLFVPPDTVIPARADRRPVATQFLGRLKPGLTIQQAQAEMQARWPELLKASVPPNSNPLEGADLWGPVIHLESMATGLSAYRTRYAPALKMILGLTGLLLLLACVNLGGLLLTRLTARGTELAVRLALGGSRRRIAQQMMVESVLLSMTGALLAIPLSFAFVAPLVALIPPGNVERTLEFTPDLRVLLVTAIIGLVVAIVMTALPTWIAMRRTASVKFTWDRTIVGTTSRWARGMLVAQVALSVVLVVGAGLLVRSLYVLQHADLGVRTDGIIDVRLMATANGNRQVDSAAYYPPLLDAVRALPGVRSAGFSRIFPRMTLEPATAVSFVGDAPGNIRALSDAISPEYFETVGIPLIAGRSVSWSDTPKTRRVGVVSESLARALSPDGNVLDRRLNFGTARDSQDVVIVGVVGNATVGNPRRSALPLLYMPMLQRPALGGNLLIAANDDAAPIVSGLRQLLQERGYEYAQEIIGLDDLFARTPSSERMSAVLGGAVGTLAVLLALVGIHGTLAYSVSRRTREIGVRVAIGASPAEVARAVLREGLLVTLTGVALGLPLALLAARSLRALLFGISEADVLTFVVTAGFFLAIGVAAGIIPARRAARVDPMIALRAE